MAEHFDPDDDLRGHQAGPGLLPRPFDFPYPWGKYDQAFVPEYNLGAMENPGLVTFTEEYVFRGRSTAGRRTRRRANTILHEMAHMWFGDLVTMAWWDDLWLKESFADFMGSFVDGGRPPGWTDAWVTFANNRKAWAYVQDQLPTTHPIVADIRDLEAAKQNFDGITYAKGAAVLKQLVAYVGLDAVHRRRPPVLRAARLRQHHAGRSASVPGARPPAGTWQPGRGRGCRPPGSTRSTPELEPRRRRPDHRARGRPGRRRRTAPRADRPHRVADRPVPRMRRARWCARTSEIDVAGPRRRSASWPERTGRDLVLVNDDDLTYAKVRLDPGRWTPCGPVSATITDPLARALCWSALWNLTRDALMPARDFIALVLRFAGRESDIGVLQTLHTWAQSALTHYAAPDWREPGGQLLAAGTLKELHAAEAGSQHQLAWARFFAAVAVKDTDFQLLQGLLDGSARIPGLEVDQELRWSLLSPLASHGVADEKAIDAELARDDTASGKRHQVRCLASRPAAEVKAQAWAALIASDALSNALVEATIAGFGPASQRELIAPFAPKYFEAIERVWAQRSIQIAMLVVRGLFPGLQADPGTLDATDAWLEGHPDAAPALRRLVLEARDELTRSLLCQACDTAAAPPASW